MPQQQEQPNNANLPPLCNLSYIIIWGGILLLLLNCYTSPTTEVENSVGRTDDAGLRNDMLQFFKNTVPRKKNTGIQNTGTQNGDIHFNGDATIRGGSIAGGDVTIKNGRKTQSGGGIYVGGSLTINGKKIPTRFSTEGLFSDDLMYVNDEITARKDDQLITVRGESAIVIDGHFIVDGIEVADDDSRIIHIDGIGQRFGRNT